MSAFFLSFIQLQVKWKGMEQVRELNKGKRKRRAHFSHLYSVGCCVLFVPLFSLVRL